VNLTIWAATELSVGILIASLPPLRTQFDKLFRKILPTRLSKSQAPGNSMPLYNFSGRYSRPIDTTINTTKGEDDGSSERHMLPEEERGEGIVKTVALEIKHTNSGEEVAEVVSHDGYKKT